MLKFILKVVLLCGSDLSASEYYPMVAASEYAVSFWVP
jgi:hypothetical protein